MTKRTISPEKIGKILIVQVAGIGDLIMAIPTLRALRDRFPRSHISLLTTPRAAGVITDSPFVDEVFTLDFNKYLRFGNFCEIVRLIKMLHKEHFNTIINLYSLATIRGSLRMSLLFYLIGAKYRVGRNTDGRGFFYNLKVPEKSSSFRHEVERNLDVARTLEADVKNKGLEITVSNRDRKHVSQFLAQSGISTNEFIIGINPGAAVPSHCWGIEKFAEMGNKLAKKYNARVIITGGPDEVELATKLIDIMDVKPVVISIGKVSLKESADLIGRCSIFITNDTAAMHIATAMRTPLIVLWGPSPLARYHPYGNKEMYIVLKKRVDCNPCHKRKCRNHKCMKLITVEDVLQAAEKLLGRFPK